MFSFDTVLSPRPYQILEFDISRGKLNREGAFNNFGSQGRDLLERGLIGEGSYIELSQYLFSVSLNIILQQ